MNIKKMMYDLIEEEISKLEQSGGKVRLKTLAKRRRIYTLIFGAVFAALFAADSLLLAFIDMVIYFVLMYMTNNASIVLSLAKKSPDKPILEIIEGDMK